MPSPMKENYYILISLIAKLEKPHRQYYFCLFYSRGEKTLFDLKLAVLLLTLK